MMNFLGMVSPSQTLFARVMSGIPIEMHPTEKMMVPEMIFGNLLTSSNYDDTVKRVTGGRNGFEIEVVFFLSFFVFTPNFKIATKIVQFWRKVDQHFQRALCLRDSRRQEGQSLQAAMALEHENL